MKLIKRRSSIMIMLVAILVMTLAIPSMAGEPDNGGFIECNAVSYEKDIHPEYYNAITSNGKGIRLNPGAALGEPDAEQSGAEDKFVGLRGFNEITYKFGASADKSYRIFNNTDEGKYDLSLTEVTWGSDTGWHVEAVDVILLDVEMSDGSILPTLKIGRAYNKIGVKQGLVEDFQISLDNNFATSGIFFPDNVKSAGSVKLIDATTECNESPTHASSYKKSNDDGYDLDAMKAYYVKEVGVKLEADKIVTGTADFTATTFAFEIRVSGDPVAYGKADVSAKNKETDVVFTDLNGNPITDWTKVLEHNRAYSISETNQGDYKLAFSGEGVSEDGEFTVRYGEKYGEKDYPVISILATNNLDNTVAGEIILPEVDGDDEGEVLGDLEPAADDGEVLGEQAKTSDEANTTSLLIVMIISITILGAILVLRRASTNK